MVTYTITQFGSPIEMVWNQGLIYTKVNGTLTSNTIAVANVAGLYLIEEPNGVVVCRVAVAGSATPTIYRSTDGGRSWV